MKKNNLLYGSALALSVTLISALFIDDARGVNVGYDEFEHWDGTAIVRSRRRYDSDGHLRQKTFFWKDGATPQQDEKYDLDGNAVEKVHYNDNGRMQANIDGWAAMRASYNNKRPKVESFYGEDGKLVARKIYNESGRLVVRQMVGDQDFDPYEQFEAQPIMGEKVLYFDRNGQFKGSAGGHNQD